MSEFVEGRFFPPPEEEPSFEIKLGDKTLVLTWDNACLKTYRIENRPEYDSMLEQFNHLCIIDYDNQGKRNSFVLFYDQLDDSLVEFMKEHSFPSLEQPKPEHDILLLLAERQPTIIPDSIGPDLGEAA